MGPTRLSVTGSEQGVAKSWYYTEVNGGGAGLIGAVAGAIAGMIINAGPSARAQKQADEMAKVEAVEALNASLVGRLKAEAAKPSSGSGLTISDVVLTRKAVTPGDIDDALEITTTYTLSEDSSVLRIVAAATYTNKAMAYKTPYTFKDKPPSSETSGPLYRNVFTYYSTPLPVPTLTPELKDRLVTSIEDSAKGASGALPAEGTSEFKSMKHEIELANDDKLTPTEISIFLTREWLKDNGARIKQEVERAHDFIARYAVLDVNRTVVPSVTGVDELIETAADERTVRRTGSGKEAGAYVSSAANVSGFATYGNTVAVSKAAVEHVKELKEQTKAGKKG